jgi:hypothetical protein
VSWPPWASLNAHLITRAGFSSSKGMDLTPFNLLLPNRVLSGLPDNRMLRST